MHFLNNSRNLYFLRRSIKKWNILSSFISEKERESSTSVTLKTLNPTRRGWWRYNAMLAFKFPF